MALILDTSIIIQLENNDKDTIKKLSILRKIHPAPPQITFVTCYEFLFGIQNRNLKNQLKAEKFLNLFNCLNATKTTAEILSKLRHKYQKKGVVLSLADLIISAQVIENNAVLLTKDNDFKKIEELNKMII